MDIQLVIRGRETEFPEKDGGHVIAEMLSCMDHAGLDTRMTGQGPLQEGQFDELRPVADNMRDSHVSGIQRVGELFINGRKLTKYLKQT
jgi:hypothetical protein